MINFKRLSVKILLFTTLLTFFFTFGFPSHQLIATYHVKQATAEMNHYQKQNVMAQSSHNDTAQSVLGTLADNLQEQYELLDREWHQEDMAQIRKTIQELKKTIDHAKKDMVQEWKTHEKVLQKAGGNKGKLRLKEKKEMIDLQFIEIEDTLDRLEQLVRETETAQAMDEGALEEVLDHLQEQLAPEVPHALLGNELPHRQLNLEPEPVILGQESESVTSQSIQTEIDYAKSTTPTEGDLEETIETKWTEEIQVVAEELGNDPLAIYEYVRHEIGFEPYYGSRKGALGTLEQRSGNDLDQASLLISLLRYHDIPARYAQGTIEIPAERAMSWVGAETPEAAARILASLGTPVRSVISGGKISAIQLEHIWVEAYVPYDEYRGVGERSGTSTWVPLDPSFVQQEYVEGLNLGQQIDLDVESIMENIHNNSERSADLLTTTRIPTDLLKEELTKQHDKLQQYLIANTDENSSLSSIMGGWEVSEEHIGYLPLSLPYKTIEELGVFQQVPDALAEQVSFQIKGASPFSLNWTGSSPEFDYTKRAAELYGKKTSLSWKPATTEDEAIIEAYGGIFHTPVYLIQLISMLKIEGEVVAEGKAVGAGYRQAFNIELTAPRIGTEIAENTVTAGGLYAVGLDYGNVTAHQLQSLEDRMTLVKEASENTDVYTDEIMGEILHGLVQGYFAQVHISDQFISKQFNVHSTGLLGETTTGYDPQVKYFFMSPVSMGEGSLYIDVNRNVVSVTSRDNSQDNQQPYMIASGIMGSALEHQIFEQTVGIPAV
jgi:hypothetical protein